jgi:hypothetical protein
MKKSISFKLLSRPFIFFNIFFFFMSPAYSNAETKFVSGNTIVSIKDAFEKPNKSIATVKTGDQVEILEEKDRFARIRTKENIEGWLPLHSLQTEMPKNETINKLKEEIAALKKRNDQFSASQAHMSADSGLNEDQKKSFIQSIDSLKTENKRLIEENQKLLHMIRDHERSTQDQTSAAGEVNTLKEKIALLQNKFDTLTRNSQDIINITKERDSLVNEIGAIRTELLKIKDHNRKGETENLIYWFFAGAIVFFIGLLSSKIFTRKKNKLSF